MLLLALAAGAMGLWWTSMRARELATAFAKRTCKTEALQFLDQTVALKGLRTARDMRGNLCLRREYYFEFTQSGEHRDKGVVTLLGHQFDNVYLPFTRDQEGNRVFRH